MTALQLQKYSDLKKSFEKSLNCAVGVFKTITYNVSGISDVADFTHQSRYEATQFNKVKMFNRSTSPAILYSNC
jgi:hypothetical protein